tara:strand:+ start:110 stop:376 length:267 start_codon:yes stop_codon:yes gene_type:complete
MDEYKNYPPEIYLKALLRTHPALADIYIQLWQSQHAMKISIKRDDVDGKFVVSPTLFKNHCLKLSRQGLLDFREVDDKFVIFLHRERK